MTVIKANYDPSVSNYDNDGMRDFFWPVRSEELVVLRDEFVAKYYKYVRSSELSRTEADLVVAFFQIVGELLKVWKAQTLISRAEAHGRDPVFPEMASFSMAYQAGNYEISNAFHSLLKKGLQSQAAWKQWLRSVRSRYRGDALLQKTLRQVDFERDTITIATGRCIEKHARSVVHPVYYLPLRYWFYPLDKSDFLSDFTRLHKISKDIGEIAAEAFPATGEHLSDLGRKYLEWWMFEMLSMGSAYLQRIMRSRETVPTRLWRGTGGLFWGRLLSIATLERGGEVVGHEHSHGMSAWQTSSNSFLEYPLSNKFVVHTKMQREMTLRCLEPGFCYPEVPEIKSLDDEVTRSYCCESSTSESLVAASAPNKSLKVMYVGTLYVQDTVTYTPIVPMQVLADWEARLFAKFLSWGWKIVYKPHPESKFSLPDDVLNQVGIECETRPFEDVCEECDVIWFAQANSSSFQNALYTDKPIVIAGTDFNPWQPEALDLVKRRCGVANIKFDQEGRFVADWEQLKHTILGSFGLSDTVFRDTLFVR